MTLREDRNVDVSERSKRSRLLRRTSSAKHRSGNSDRDYLRDDKKTAISKIPANINNTNDLHSRRLVDYIVVYSCKPRIRGMKSNGAEEKGGGSGLGKKATDKASVAQTSRRHDRKSPGSRDNSARGNSNRLPATDDTENSPPRYGHGTPPRTPTINNKAKVVKPRYNQELVDLPEKSCIDGDNSESESIPIDEEVTPSRIRARKSFESDDNEDTKVLSKLAIDDSDESELLTKLTIEDTNPLESLKHPIKPDRGASKNIHMPDDGSDSCGGTLRELYFVPIQTSRYPLEDHTDSPLNPMISHFCYPNSQTIEQTTEYKMPRIHYFVLTDDRGKKMYGTCLTIYEEFLSEESSPECKEEEKALDWIKKKRKTVETHSTGGPDIEVSLKSSENSRTIFIPKVICLLSSWPYLHAFREYISQLYRLACLTDQMNVPLERYILNICKEIPAPPPGSFEIRLKICTSTIRFWAPPANQPITYVSLPFEILFECLDTNNILYVWYALNLEQKVLLVSSQYSLLTLCAEILCSLLFPMQWSHLYIPILPRFLSPMLDAPMPYLCGISRDILPHAIGDISDETIIVDLDKNIITVGTNTPTIPVMPTKRKTKLEHALIGNTRDIFLNARGLNESDLQDEKPFAEANKIMEGADRVWQEKLQTYDDAFNLAFAPNSENAINGKNNTARACGQHRWDVVQEAFLRFYVAILEDYRRFLSYKSTPDAPSQWQASNHVFYMKGFISAQRSHFRPFLEDFCRTQLFDDFITKRMYNPEEPDVMFFDQSITAKMNRSKMTLKKKATPFLQSAKAHKVLKKINAVEPNDADGDCASSRNLLDQFFASADQDKKKFSYASWPEKLDPKLFGKARDIPEIIAAEFDRRASLALRLNENRSDFLDGDFEAGDCHPSLAVATFTVYFLLFSDVIGRELDTVRNKYKTVKPGVMSKPENIDNPSPVSWVKAGKYRGPNSGLVPNCSVSMCPSEVSKAICCDERTVQNPSTIVRQPSNGNIHSLNTDKWQLELDEAKVVATAQLDLAFSALRTMTLRKIPTDPDAYRFIMEACGRCGSSHRATELLRSMRNGGLVLDSEIYSKYLTAFTVSNEISPDEAIGSPLSKVPSTVLNDVLHETSSRRKKTSGSAFFSKKKKTSRKMNSSYHSTDVSSINGSSRDSWSAGSSPASMSVNSSVAASSAMSRSMFKKTKKLKRIGELRTTEQIKTHIIMGDSLLDVLYEDLKLDTSGDACTKCSLVLSEDQIMLGWRSCSFNDYTTECPQCKHRFVARFSVTSSSPTFTGSQGIGTPLYCEFLSPWVLRKEIHATMSNDEDYGSILRPDWRSGTDIRSTLWWNLIVSFRRHRLAITFLLQGSFRNQLIMPMPDT